MLAVLHVAFHEGSYDRPCTLQAWPSASMRFFSDLHEVLDALRTDDPHRITPSPEVSSAGGAHAGYRQETVRAVQASSRIEV